MSGDGEVMARGGRETAGGGPGADALPDPGGASGGGRPFELAPTRDDLDRLLKRRGPGRRVAVVMTMGALHEGHASLIRAARARVGREGFVVTTVFVNPLQFGAGEDLDRYPRTLDADLRTARSAGADTVFAPSVDEVYPGGDPRVTIAAGAMGRRFEGASRPGHFDGMLTVVAKLLHLTSADVAFFGQKDAQQLALIRRMVTDLNFPVEIAGVPTVREDDGLALSSRNRYLSATDRRTALLLSRALFAARDRLGAQHALRARAESAPASGARAAGLSALGEPRLAADAHAVACAGGPALPGGAASAGADAVRAAALGVLDLGARTDPPLALDYLALIDPADFTEVPDDFTGEAVLAVAARVGTTRLIDNIPLTFGATSG
ncbi:pantoate--beta-alanine ligase [Streptomyces sp. NBC_01497]|uniref:pantoate--beta-alanine ligase n=1 Tax=Streptomyces sp. NBC_01497 TaxID=2903885 RepID=UPI002E2FF960|nr:pantoate--beta-alanine ligase [Streptomyces sp. NBC_01497]